jgi:hypothetical protein
MPVVNTNGPKNAVTPIFLEGVDSEAHYFVAPDDTYASVQATPPTGALVILPGPDSTGETGLPSNGDFYRVADPLGKIAGGTPVGVWGGGYPINGSSHATAVADVSLDTAFSEAEFTFDDTAQAWIACICVPGGD